MLVVCRGMVGGVGLRGTDLENAMGEPAKVFQFNLVPSVRLPLGSGGHQPAGDPLQAPDRVVPHGVDRRSRQGAGAGAEVEADQRQGQEEEEADHGHGVVKTDKGDPTTPQNGGFSLGGLDGQKPQICIIMVFGRSNNPI